MHNRLRVSHLVAAFVTSIGTSVLVGVPGWAATFSSSEATFEVNNFSVLPLDVTALHDAKTQVIAPDGLVKSNADADALFLTDALNQSSSRASGSSSSVVSGSGNSYFGFAQSIAQVVGYSFQIGHGETFSFDFTNSLNLQTAIDQPGIETATAIGTIGLGLFDAADPNNLTLLDFLTIAGSLGTPGNSNALTVDQSAGITFSTRQTALNSALDGKQASASASVQGSLSHFFANPTSLLLVEYGSNQAAAAVPEPSNVLASLVCLGLLGLRFWRKPKLKQP
ncbi:hypothetical protein C7B82_08720 [Stenomitos frigidus ULC18]|uniref:PEP-CTERM sorting domain-containing protein n=2 Tax=Stenomitos TaxID=1844270 RepID=A0A2T1ECT9_9CYAN|nr:hypothetical protein C7B82_08720 [Stenomitos frigidus ULC18]